MLTLYRREPILVRHNSPLIQDSSADDIIHDSISNTQEDGPVKNQIAKALVERIIRAGQQGTKFRVVVVIPEVPGFAGQGE